MRNVKSNKTLTHSNRLTELKTNQDFNGQQPTKEQIQVKVKDTPPSNGFKLRKKGKRCFLIRIKILTMMLRNKYN